MAWNWKSSGRRFSKSSATGFPSGVCPEHHDMRIRPRARLIELSGGTAQPQDSITYNLGMTGTEEA
jgi:hypothetical protein